MWLRIICLFIAVFICTDALCNEKESIRKENSLLESELKLARSPNIYFIFDLKNAKIYLKARGTLLKEFDIERVLLWGNSVVIKPLLLSKKSTFIEPRRIKIKPGENKKQDEFKIDAMESDDMPARYTLDIDESISIYVKSIPEATISVLCNAGYSVKQILSRPIMTIWNTLRERPFTAIDIVLNKKDAQAIYWSFTKGTATIIYPP